VRELPHEAAVNPVLPSPHPCAFEGDRSTRRYGVPIAGRDERQKLPLREILLERLTQQRTSQVSRKRQPLTHCEHSGLGTRVVHHRSDIAGGEHVAVRNRPKRPRYLDEAVGVHGEARLGKPRSRSRLRGPERFVNLVRPTVSRAKYTARDFDHATAMMHADSARCENPFEPSAYRRVVR